MPKVSKTTVEQQDFGPAHVHEGDVEGYTISFGLFDETIDMAPMFAGALPDGMCQCPHWGYVLKGTLAFRFADHKEVFEAGDAFFVGPGHVPTFEAGTEMVQFSPTEELRATDAAIRSYMEANGGAPPT